MQRKEKEMPYNNVSGMRGLLLHLKQLMLSLEAREEERREEEDLVEAAWVADIQLRLS